MSKSQNSILSVSVYGLIVLGFLLEQSELSTLTDIYDRLSFCAPSDDWEVSKASLRIVVKSLVDNQLVIESDSAIAKNYEISALGKQYFELTQSAVELIKQRTWNI